MVKNVQREENSQCLLANWVKQQNISEVFLRKVCSRTDSGSRQTSISFGEQVLVSSQYCDHPNARMGWSSSSKNQHISEFKRKLCLRSFCWTLLRNASYQQQSLVSCEAWSQKFPKAAGGAINQEKTRCWMGGSIKMFTYRNFWHGSNSALWWKQNSKTLCSWATILILGPLGPQK